MHECLAVCPFPPFFNFFPRPFFCLLVDREYMWVVGLDPCLDWDTIHASGFYAKIKKEGNPIYGRTGI